MEVPPLKSAPGSIGCKAGNSSLLFNEASGQASFGRQSCKGPWQLSTCVGLLQRAANVFVLFRMLGSRHRSLPDLGRDDLCRGEGCQVSPAQRARELAGTRVLGYAPPSRRLRRICLRVSVSELHLLKSPGTNENIYMYSSDRCPLKPTGKIHIHFSKWKKEIPTKKRLS